MKRVWWTAGAIAAGSFLAACGGDSETSLVQTDSPLQEALGIDFSDPTSFQEENEVAIAEAGEATVECMREAGFEFVPQDGQIVFEDPRAAQTEGLSAREYAEQFGWGATTFFGPDLDDFTGQTFTDPNSGYVESLSDAERDAYFAALYGDFPEFDPGVDEDVAFEEFEPSGCESLAFEAAFASEDSAFSVFDELGDELAQMEEDFQADPRIVEFDRSWTECMGEAGFDYDTPVDAQMDMFSWMDPVYDSSTFPGIDLNESDFEAMSEEQLEAIFSQPPEFDQELIDSIRVEERNLAVASLDCGFPPPPIEQPQIYLVVRFELEQAFVDANADAFDNAG